MDKSALYILFISVPVILILSWMIFIWNLRGRFLLSKFEKAFGKAESNLDDQSITNMASSGKLISTANLGEYRISLFRQYSLIGTRFIWYLLVTVRGDTNMHSDKKVVFFGKGAALDYYCETNKGIETHDAFSYENKFDNALSGWEFVEVMQDKRTYFFRMPDFIGIGLMNKLKKTLSN